MNIIVLGAGTFGTAIANELSVNKNNNVTLFSRNRNKVDEINIEHTNKSCFPNKHLTEVLQASFDKNILKNANIILVALPSSVILDALVALKPYFNKDILFVNLSKGLFVGGVTIVDKIKETLNTDNVVTLKGPSFAVELMEHADTLLTLGYTTLDQNKKINEIVKNTALHLDFTNDIRGVEVLSVLKNIYALVLGVIDAKYNSPNTRFMILTKSFLEIRVLLRTLGGSEDTLSLACGFGDLCMTSLNDLSRNRTLGLLIGKGFFNADYKSNSVILEGLNSIDMFYNLLNKQQKKNLPLFNKLYNYFSNQEKDLDFNFSELVD